MFKQVKGFIGLFMFIVIIWGLMLVIIAPFIGVGTAIVSDNVSLLPVIWVFLNEFLKYFLGGIFMIVSGILALSRILK